MTGLLRRGVADVLALLSDLDKEFSPETLGALALAAYCCDMTEEEHEYLERHCELSVWDAMDAGFWLMSAWHGGVNSTEYETLCSIMRVYQPSISACGPEPHSSAELTYELWEEYYKELWEC